MQKQFERSFDEIARIVQETERFFREEELDAGLRTAVDLCIEELFVNMVNYNTESDQQISISMTKIPDGIEVCLTDYDVERFDPTQSRDVDIEAPLSERSPGGLGVYLVLKMVDSIHYQYHDRQSKITFQIKGG